MSARAGRTTQAAWGRVSKGHRGMHTLLCLHSSLQLALPEGSLPSQTAATHSLEAQSQCKAASEECAARFCRKRTCACAPHMPAGPRENSWRAAPRLRPVAAQPPLAQLHT